MRSPIRAIAAPIAFLVLLSACGPGAAVPPSPGVELVQNATTSGLPTIAEFGAATCASCRDMKTVLDSVARRTEGRAHVLIIDIRKDYEAAQAFRIQMMPTQVFFGPDGREIWRHIGKLTEDEVISRLGISATP